MGGAAEWVVGTYVRASWESEKGSGFGVWEGDSVKGRMQG